MEFLSCTTETEERFNGQPTINVASSVDKSYYSTDTKARMLFFFFSDFGTEPVGHRDPVEETRQTAVRGARSPGTNSHGKN